MDRSLGVLHNCEGMSTRLTPGSACVDIVGLGAWGIVIAVAVVAGLGLLGWLLWRRMRNRFGQE